MGGLTPRQERKLAASTHPEENQANFFIPSEKFLRFDGRPMRSLVVLALLSLLCSSTDAKMKYMQPRQPQSTFGFPEFTVGRKPELNFGGKARLGNASIRDNVVELTPDADNYENTLQNPNADVKGSVFYNKPIHLINRYTTASFQSVFAFSMKPVYPSNTGDGIAFIMTSNPKGIGDSLGNFGFFHHGRKKHGTLAVEFDTFRNNELSDIDNNHVGVDLEDPVSAVAVSARSVGITLNSGKPVTAWVEYSAPLQILEVRVQIGLSNHSRPDKALITLPLALKQVMEEDMWIGFSAGTHYGQNQLHYIYSWGFSVDYITPDSKVLYLSRNGKIVLIVVLCGSFIILSIGFVLFRYCRKSQVQDEDVEDKSWGKKLADIVLENDDAAKPEEMPSSATQVDEGDAEEDMPGVLASCLPFQGRQYHHEEEDEEVQHTRGCFPRIMSSSPRWSRGEDSPRSNFHQSEDDTIMYSNSMYTSDDDDKDVIPVYPYDAYPDERIDSIAYSKPGSYKPPNPQSRSPRRSRAPSPPRRQ